MAPTPANSISHLLHFQPFIALRYRYTEWKVPILDRNLFYWEYNCSVKAGELCAHACTLQHPPEMNQRWPETNNLLLNYLLLNIINPAATPLYFNPGQAFYNHAIFFTITPLGSVSYCTHFIDEETEVQRDHVICPQWCHMAKMARAKNSKPRFIWHQSLYS